MEKTDTRQADFRKLSSHHAYTLINLGLRAIGLLEQGEWVSNLVNVQKTLRRNSPTIRKSIYCEDPSRCWLLEASVYEDGDDEIAQDSITSKALSAYRI